MSDQQQPEPEQYRVVAFRSFGIAEDGEHVVFALSDRQGGSHHIAVNWHDLSGMAHMLNQAGVAAAQQRVRQGKTDDFTGVGSAQIVARFAVNDVPDRNLRIVSFFSPSGLRADFALPRDQQDQNGRPVLQAIAAELAK